MCVFFSNLLFPDKVLNLLIPTGRPVFKTRDSTRLSVPTQTGCLEVKYQPKETRVQRSVVSLISFLIQKREGHQLGDLKEEQKKHVRK